MHRLYTTPLTAWDFILGYALPIIPISVAQSLVCYIFAVILGMPVNANIIAALIFIVPIAILYTGMGLLFGSILNVKQAGGICGALLTNLTAWLSGVWFDLELVGEGFRKVAHALPFVHAVELERAIIAGNFGVDCLVNIGVITIYATLATLIAIVLFLRQMKSGRN
jgi:ABC-2 type transport system permease protein